VCVIAYTLQKPLRYLPCA